MNKTETIVHICIHADKAGLDFYQREDEWIFADKVTGLEVLRRDTLDDAQYEVESGYIRNYSAELGSFTDFDPLDIALDPVFFAAAKTWYETVTHLAKSALKSIEGDYYKGYNGAMALALFLDDAYAINVNCDDEAQRAFEDVLAS